MTYVLAKKQGEKTISNEGVEKNLDWMKRQIEEINSKPNSYTVCDTSELESAMKKAEEFGARSVYHR